MLEASRDASGRFVAKTGGGEDSGGGAVASPHKLSKEQELAKAKAAAEREAAELEEAALLRRKITDADVATICTLAMVTSFVKVWADCPLASSVDADALRKHPDNLRWLEKVMPKFRPLCPPCRSWCCRRC